LEQLLQDWLGHMQILLATLAFNIKTKLALVYYL
jgi:hypothetical protein